MGRKCRSCHTEKTERDFDSIDRKTCIECREKEQARYSENREQINAKQRERWRCRSQSQKESDSLKRSAYRAQHRNEQKVYGQAHYQRNRQNLVKRKRSNKLRFKYGITPEEFDSLLKKQGGHCAVCDRTIEEDGRHLSVDHDHETGRLRGILCAKHNHALGLCGDDPKILIELALYLIQNKHDGPT